LTKQYDPKNVSLIFGGFTLSGYADGTFITVNRLNDSFRDIIGCDGEVGRLKTLDGRGDIGVTLLKTSGANLFMSSISNGDEILAKGLLPSFIKDTNGRNVYSASESWILKPGQMTYSKSIDVVVWVIRCKHLIMFTGG